jgi:uncharacterized membrane protein
MTASRLHSWWPDIGIGLGAIPFIIWRLQAHNRWPDFFLAAYLLTAYNIALLIINYPGKGNRWYWRVVLAAAAVNCTVVALFFLAGIALVAMGIKSPTGILFAAVGAALLLQAQARIYFYKRFNI